MNARLLDAEGVLPGSDVAFPADAAALCRSRARSLRESGQHLAANEAEKCARAIEGMACVPSAVATAQQAALERLPRYRLDGDEHEGAYINRDPAGGYVLLDDVRTLLAQRLPHQPRLT